MDRIQQAAPEGGILIIKAHSDLNIRGWDQSTFEVQGDADGIKIIAEENATHITSLDDCTLQVPIQYSLQIEKANGDAWLQNLSGDVHVIKVGGDLSASQLVKITIDRVGGDCVVEEIATAFSCQHVGGDLTGSNLKNGMLNARVGGDCRLNEVNGGVRLDAGGDVHIGLSESIGEEVMLRAGGDVSVHIPPQSSWDLDLASGGEDIRVELNGVQEQIEDWALLRILGDGKSPLRVKAGGEILISDNLAPEGKKSHHARKNEEHWLNLQAMHMPRFQAAMNAVSRTEEISERIAQKTESAVRKAESRIQRAMEKMEKHGFDFSAKDTGFTNTDPIPPGDGETVTQPVSFITEEEKLVVLRMLQDKKLSIEEADSLLDALEYSAQE